MEESLFSLQVTEEEILMEDMLRLDRYARFLAWCDEHLSSLDACKKIFPELQWTTGKKDFNFDDGRDYNYFFHRYHFNFQGQPAYFLQITQSVEICKVLKRLCGAFNLSNPDLIHPISFSHYRIAHQFFAYLDWHENGKGLFDDLFTPEESNEKWNLFLNKHGRCWERYWFYLTAEEKEMVRDYVVARKVEVKETSRPWM